MTELVGDLWTHHNPGTWIAITTNGTWRRDGACVMGRGVALEAAHRFPDLPFALGQRLRDVGTMVQTFERWKIVAFPVKHHWRDAADLRLIERSATELAAILGDDPEMIPRLVMVRPGCGNGRLLWTDVKPVLLRGLGVAHERVVIVERTLE